MFQISNGQTTEMRKKFIEIKLKVYKLVIFISKIEKEILFLFRLISDNSSFVGCFESVIV